MEVKEITSDVNEKDCMCIISPYKFNISISDEKSDNQVSSEISLSHINYHTSNHHHYPPSEIINISHIIFESLSQNIITEILDIPCVRNGSTILYDPESSYFIRSKKTLIFQNRFLAYLFLKNTSKITRENKTNRFLKENVEYLDILLNMMIDGTEYNFNMNRPELYGRDSIFDEDIIFYAKEQNYDAIILKFSQMQNKIQTEIISLTDEVPLIKDVENNQSPSPS